MGAHRSSGRDIHSLCCKAHAALLQGEPLAQAVSPELVVVCSDSKPCVQATVPNCVSAWLSVSSFIVVDYTTITVLVDCVWPDVGASCGQNDGGVVDDVNVADV